MKGKEISRFVHLLFKVSKQLNGIIGSAGGGGGGSSQAEIGNRNTFFKGGSNYKGGSRVNNKNKCPIFFIFSNLSTTKNFLYKFYSMSAS